MNVLEVALLRYLLIDACHHFIGEWMFHSSQYDGMQSCRMSDHAIQYILTQPDPGDIGPTLLVIVLLTTIQSCSPRLHLTLRPAGSDLL